MSTAPAVLPRPSRTQPVSVTELIAAQQNWSADLRLSLPGSLASITGITLRAQHVLPGDLYAALPGFRVHGADFADKALAAGAVTILTDEAGAERPAVRNCGVAVLVHPDPRAIVGQLAAFIYGNPSKQLQILGVTGTAGKTTTTYLIDSALQAAGHTTGLIGSVETGISGRRFAKSLNTPEAPDLQALFAVMVEQGVKYVTMEVSSHALALGRVTGTEFAVGAFTNLSQDHLDFHADFEDYFAAKAKLFDGRSAREVVCTDTPWGRRLVKNGTITVSTVDNAEWTARDRKVSVTGSQAFTAVGPNGRELPITLPLPGAFNVANALLAIGCLTAIDISDKAIVEGLATVAVPGRMELVDLGQDFTAVVDYSHKPKAVELALDAVVAQAKARVIVVLGCGGDRDKGKRPLMGEAAARRAALTIITDDNPRTEDPATIRAEMLAGALAVPEAERGEVIEIGDRRSAIRHAVAKAQAGDVVIIAGKGHESGQEINGMLYPFSDRDELTEAINAAISAHLPKETV